MCGICCICSCVPSEGGHVDWKDFIEKNSRIHRRGPDSNGSTQVMLDKGRQLFLQGHVLHLRGQLTPQPLQDHHGNKLLWNGEIFGGIEVAEEENDTQVLLADLSSSDEPSHLLATMAKIQGPWAFIYWEEKTRRLWFGRDMFGRRSLLWHLPLNKDDQFILSSTQIGSQVFQEIPSVGIYCVNFPENHNGCDLDIHLYQRDEAVWPGTMERVDITEDLTYKFWSNQSLKLPVTFSLDKELKFPSHMPKLNKSLPDIENDLEKKFLENLSLKKTESATAVDLAHQKYIEDLIHTDQSVNKLADQLMDVLKKAIRKRIYNQPDLCDLESKLRRSPCSQCKPHLDSKRRTNISGEKLMTVGKDMNPDNDTCGSIGQLEDENCTRKQCGSKELSLGSRDAVCCHGDDPVVSTLPSNTCENSSEIKTISEAFSDAREEICSKGDNTMHCRNKDDADSCCMEELPNIEQGHVIASDCHQDHAKVAILFSGGIDSAVITALVDRCLPESEPVDLLNVAFEQQIKPTGKQRGTMRNTVPDDQLRWNVPDRVTGYSALAELNPRRQWNFIQVNVSLPELQQVRSEHVRHLVYPLDTVLDDSIGCAVWFAARGQGVIGNGSRLGQPYTSHARVILCGMGADEQLAGYSRHRGRYGEQGWRGLLEEMELEITRISARNLGRDDRIITDHSKESRFPFLDENVVEFLSSVPIQYKANLDLPRGLGEKLLLRVCATKLGLLSTAVLPKRAIQFGSRIAKMENNKEKASDKCKRLAD